MRDRDGRPVTELPYDPVLSSRQSNSPASTPTDSNGNGSPGGGRFGGIDGGIGGDGRGAASSAASSAALRTLLPAVGAGSSQASMSPSTPSDQMPRKRITTQLACEACRRRKSRCNGARPKCHLCASRNLNCVYREPMKNVLKRKMDELEDSSSALNLIRALQSRSDGEASEIFQRLRAGADAEAVMRHITAADLLLQVHLKPETRFRYVFPDKNHMPASLLTADNPYLHSRIYELAYAKSDEVDMITTSTGALDVTDKCQVPYLRPYHAASIVDTRLDYIVPANWTTVSRDNAFMKTLMRTYFFQEYPWFTYFHKDHFLDDMLSGEGRFCSSSLVNALLAIGYTCHTSLPRRSEYWNPQSLGYQFLAEARRLWEIEAAQPPTLTTLQSSLLINILLNIQGMDILGRPYLVRAADMARQMELFEGSEHIKDTRMRQSRNYTAWCLFYWQSVASYHFRSPPLFDSPPTASIPDPKQDPGWFGEFWIRYPLEDVLIPMHFGCVLKAKFQFSVILSKAMTQPLDRRSHAMTNASERIATMLTDLRAWYDKLPEELAPQRIVLPWELKVHLHFYDVCIGLYEMLASHQQAGLLSPVFHGYDVQGALKQCKTRFETLVRLYFLRHGFDAGDTMACQFLTVLAFLSLDSLDKFRGKKNRKADRENESRSPSTLKMEDEANSGGSSSSASSTPEPGPVIVSGADAQVVEDLKSAIVMAVKGLGDQGKSYYFPQTMMHVVQSRMNKADAEQVRKYANIDEESSEARSRRAAHIQSSYPVTIVKDPKEKLLDDWMQQYAEMKLTDDTDQD